MTKREKASSSSRSGAAIARSRFCSMTLLGERQLPCSSTSRSNSFWAAKNVMSGRSGQARRKAATCESPRTHTGLTAEGIQQLLLAHRVVGGVRCRLRHRLDRLVCFEEHAHHVLDARAADGAQVVLVE